MNKITLKSSHFLIPCLIFCITFFILWSLVGSQPIGHDESVYLTKARSWTEATPADEFEVYRPIGMPVFGWTLLNFGDSEKYLRTFGVIFGSISILFIFLFFRKIFNIFIATGITGVVVTSSLFLHEAPLFQNDIASSGFLIGILYILYIYYQSAGRSRSIYFLGPFAALAFYIRYGVASTFLVIGIVTLLTLVPKFIKKKDADFSKLKGALIIFFILFIPHFIQSVIVEKKLLGILSRSGEVAHRKYLGEGLVDYIKWLPSELGGWLLGITAIIGIIATVFIILRKKLQKKYMKLMWIGSIGLLNFILTGLLVHAEPRYVFFPMILLSGTGIAMLYYLIINRSKIFIRFVAVTSLLIIAYWSVVSYVETNGFFMAREADLHSLGYIKVSEAIREDSAGSGSCAVWAITSNRPKISWYSRCNTLRISDPITFEKDFHLHLRGRHYSVVRSKLDDVQIDQHTAEKFGVVLTEIFRTENLSEFYGGNLVLYRITRIESAEEDYLNLLEGRL